MPELPEVETIRRGLGEFIKFKKVRRVEVLCEKSFRGEPGLVEGAEVAELRRRGKALILDLKNGYSVLTHLRMTGQMIFRFAMDPFLKKGVQPPKNSSSSKSGACPDFDEINNFAGGHPSDNFIVPLPNKQTRVILEFEDGTLYFNDQRKFGFMKVMRTEEVEEDEFIAGLGPEPWEMSAEEMYEALQRHKKAPVKAVLLDQKVVAGLGNIYADESCHYAGVRPMRLAGEVSPEEAKLLLEGARKTMEASIEAGGSTMATYRKADGSKGDYLEKFAKVFHREGQECGRCGAIIVKTRCAGRGTHYCPECQK